jgi:hypothetical protein
LKLISSSGIRSGVNSFDWCNRRMFLFRLYKELFFLDHFLFGNYHLYSSLTKCIPFGNYHCWLHPFRELSSLTPSLSGTVISDYILFQDMPFLCVSNPLNSSFLRFW